ncbi:Myosin-binding protein 3 [Vitis vinifera]|uniref:Myosin-binding protein 3 n=1 Tax=Vitis vinifera TaxID=29760 RepID=A0A438DHZ4_VITVI|nr:Myosin-binding protein 3 [Vitis vinifera]
MAPNKFATMLHMNTHKITVILVYAVLEWLLIILLLLNSFLFYFISKFAAYFGLKPPCLWCARVDHLFEPPAATNATQSYYHLVCEAHASEISKLAYCWDHRKLVKWEDMCNDCSSSHSGCSGKPFEISHQMAFFSSMPHNNAAINGERDRRCCCCDHLFTTKFCPPYFLFKPSWNILEYSRKGNLIVEEMHSEIYGDDFSDNCENQSEMKHNVEADVGNDQVLANEQLIVSDVQRFLHPSSDDAGIQTCCRADEPLEIINLHSKIQIHPEFHRIIPFHLIDSSTTENQRSYKFTKGGLRQHELQHHGTFHSESLIKSNEEIPWISKDATLLVTNAEKAEKTMSKELESLEMGAIEDSVALNTGDGRNEDLVDKACEQSITSQAAQNVSTDTNDREAKAMKEPDDPTAAPEGDSFNLSGDEIKSEILTDMKAFDYEPTDQAQTQESIPLLTHLGEDQPLMICDSIRIITSPDPFIAENDQGLNHTEKAAKGESINFAEENQQGIKLHLSLCSEACEVVIQFFTIERLTAALEAERKALRALYAELEEERSASAIAANQTMAMITRLQEEKAAMQMEALQYQRMMEEQSEYDQEALQLLNELMIKREKEKQELEKELEIHRKKVLDYESKEKMMRRRKDVGSIRSRISSATCSNAEDSDELSIDLNQEGKDEDSSFCGHQERNGNSTPGDATLDLDEMGLECVNHLSTLEESLAEFEEERMCILEQLKALEEKLFTLGDDEQFFEDVEQMEQFPEHNGKELDKECGFGSGEVQGVSNGLPKEMSGKQYSEKKTKGSNAKSLLPLFDAIHIESEEGVLEEVHVESDSARMLVSSVSQFELEHKKLAIEEEVDHVYERLQALEADREFMKHCISSLKKGDKGMDLLQEILQHLRDLRTVEVRVRNMGDTTLI